MKITTNKNFDVLYQEHVLRFNNLKADKVLKKRINDTLVQTDERIYFKNHTAYSEFTEYFDNILSIESCGNQFTYNCNSDDDFVHFDLWANAIKMLLKRFQAERVTNTTIYAHFQTKEMNYKSDKEFYDELNDGDFGFAQGKITFHRNGIDYETYSKNLEMNYATIEITL